MLGKPNVAGIWHGAPDRVLTEQTYPGREDDEKHFYYLLKAFADHRHVTVDGKPLLLIYRPWEMPNIAAFTHLWKQLAVKAGLKGLFIVSMQKVSDSTPEDHGLDGFVVPSLGLPKDCRRASRICPARFKARILQHSGEKGRATGQREARGSNLLFIKSWNEWAEENYLEPDLKFGKGYLEVLRQECFEISPTRP